MNFSDAHTGLKQAIDAVLLGSAWQRCRVHFMRNVLAVVPKGNSEIVAAAIPTIFADRRYFSERSMALLTATTSSQPEGQVSTPELISA